MTTSKAIKEKNHISVEAKRFKAFRKAEGLSQKQMAAILEVTQPHVSYYEDGSVTISVDVIRKLHDVFKMSYEWFFDGTLPRKIKNEPKKNLITSLDEMKVENTVLQGKIQTLEQRFNKLAAEFYAMKHNV